jgi:hypothetical protein
MSALLVAAPAAVRPRALLAVAGLVALHSVDHYVVHSAPGTSAADHVPALLTTAVLPIAAAFGAERAGSRVRALAAFLLGAFALVFGAMSAWHVGADRLAGDDLTGLVLLPAGVVAFALAIAALRGRPAAPGWRRWRNAATGAVVVLGVLLFVVEPLGVALYVNAKPRIPVDPAALGIAHQDVTFRSSDGLRLAGWYVPSRNGAAVLVVHGSGGSRGGAVLHARMLARAGYGVLLYDARGRGGSEGDPEGMGWTWQRDVAGALAWLKARHDVDPDRIAGLGLSTGAEVLLQAAAQRHDLRAVVADGTEARSLGEARELGARDAAVIGLTGMMELGTRALTGHAPPPELKSLATRVGRDRLMLISTGTGPEAKYSRIYARAAGAPLWELPGTAHTKGLATHPREYERRVLGFLGAALAR